MSKIPEQKHSDKELSRLRAQSAMQASNSPIVETYNKKLAHKFTIFTGYLLPLIAPFWVMVKKFSKDPEYTMTDFWIMAIPIVIALIIALWIAIKRVLSRHNSAFILILSLLCSFAIISAVNSDKFLKYELMSMIGKDEPAPDPLLKEDPEDIEVGNNSGNMTDEDREALRKAEADLLRSRSEWEREKRLREEQEKSAAPTTPDL